MINSFTKKQSLTLKTIVKCQLQLWSKKVWQVICTHRVKYNCSTTQLCTLGIKCLQCKCNCCQCLSHNWTKVMNNKSMKHITYKTWLHWKSIKLAKKCCARTMTRWKLSTVFFKEESIKDG